LKKNAALLTLIPVLFLSTYPLVYRSSTLSDLTKGSVAGLYIGLALVALFTSKSDQKGADR
jgi:hypothetical protein